MTLDRSDIEFGEINNAYINNEFDATIVETGYHDNQLDAEMLRDPRVRDALGRATYQGLVRYFSTVDSGATSVTMVPGKVTDVRAVVDAVGEVSVHWTPPVANSYVGDAPTGYYVYGSTDGYGFDGGTYVSGSQSDCFTFTGLDTGAGPYYFKVVAANNGGQGQPSEAVGAVPAASSSKVLVVNGFDRFERRLSPVEPYNSGTIQRVRPELTNSMDYVVQHIDSIHAYNPGLRVESTSNENIVNGSVALGDYDAVVWILGEESTANDTFSTVEQTLVSTYLQNSGNLFLSGSEIGWDLDQQGNGAFFYNNRLRANYSLDDANTYRAGGVSGSIFAGISLDFDDGSSVYDVTFPDVITPFAGSTAAMTYVGGAGGTAAVQYGTPGNEQVVMLGFPFETILAEQDRDDVMDRVLTFFEVDADLSGDLDQNGLLDCTDILVVRAAVDLGLTDLVYDMNGDMAVNIADQLFWITDLKGTVAGDANLDFVVDELDFDIWNANRFTSDTNWCTADFNFDRLTDVSDFNLWNQNRDTVLATFAEVAVPGVPRAAVKAAPPIVVSWTLVANTDDDEEE